MANSVLHGGLPYPIRNARYSLLVPYLDATGTPTDPVTPDTEVSKDGGAFADCAEEATLVTPAGSGVALITLTSLETDCVMLAVAAKSASGPKTTLATLTPRTLPILRSGTAQGGSTSTITLDAGASAIDGYNVGCIVRTTGGTGGGGANNQARVISAYDGTTKVATVANNFEVAPDATTTFDLLITENALLTYADVRVMAANVMTAAAAAPDLTVELQGGLSTLDGPAVASAVWDTLKAGHGVPDSFGDYLDAKVSAGGGGGGGPTPEEIAAAVLAAAVGAPVAPPVAPYTVESILGWILAISKFRRTQSTSEEVLYGDNGTTAVATSAKTDVGGIFTRDEYQ